MTGIHALITYYQDLTVRHPPLLNHLFLPNLPAKPDLDPARAAFFAQECAQKNPATNRAAFCQTTSDNRLIEPEELYRFK
jgi:hypothetical protein